MIEERAIICDVQPDHIWVESNRRQGCAKCEAGQGCGGGVLGKLAGQRSVKLQIGRADVTQDLQVGDQVLIGLPEKTLLYASVMTYLLPLLALFCGAIVVDLIFDPHDLVVALAGFAALFAMLLVMRRYAPMMPGYIRPTLLKRLGPSGASPALDQGCAVRAE